MIARGEGWKEGIVGKFGMDTYTLLYLKWITNKDLLCSTWNSAQCYVAAWRREGFEGRMATCIYMAEFLCYAPETITTIANRIYSNIK